MKSFALSLAAFIIATQAHGQLIKAFSLTGGAVYSRQHNIGSSPSFQYNNYSQPLYGWTTVLGITFIQKKYVEVDVQAGYMLKGSTSGNYGGISNWVSTNGSITQQQTYNYYHYTDKQSFAYLVPRVFFRCQIKNITPYLFAGPRLDVFIANRYRLYGDEDKLIISQRRTSIPQGGNRFILGYNCGIGAEVKVYKNIAVCLEVSAVQDITSYIYKEFNTTTPTGEERAKGCLKFSAYTSTLTFKHYIGRG